MPTSMQSGMLNLQGSSPMAWTQMTSANALLLDFSMKGTSFPQLSLDWIQVTNKFFHIIQSTIKTTHIIDLLFTLLYNTIVCNKINPEVKWSCLSEIQKPVQVRAKEAYTPKWQAASQFRIQGTARSSMSESLQDFMGHFYHSETQFFLIGIKKDRHWDTDTVRWRQWIKKSR